MTKLRILLSIFSVMFCIFTVNAQTTKNSLEGNWSMLKDLSTEIDLYGTLSVDLKFSGSNVILKKKWGTSRSLTQEITLPLDGTTVEQKVTDRVFPSNVFMGLSMPVGEKVKYSAKYDTQKQILTVTENYNILGSQGESPVTATETYELSPSKETLILSIQRSTRTDGPEKYVFKPAGTRDAYCMNLVDDWNLDSKLPEQAMLISLQGIVNKQGPELYFTYPDKWDYKFTPQVKKYFQTDRYYTFKQLRTAEQAVKTFKDKVHNYVVWDKKVRTSLTVAFTIAGLKDAVVVNEDLIPLIEKYGYTKVADLRNKFEGQNDAQIYKWAYGKYGKDCNKDYIVWMGGAAGNRMQPGVADWGIYKKAFFTDLSARKTDTEEYKLAKEILSKQNHLSMVFGWHSYAKDLEREFTTLTSSLGLRVEGLNTLPNMSFTSQVPATPGFKFKNHINIKPGKTYKPEKKVYVACVQTDCLGLGAWTDPGRGNFPYAWEVTMNWLWLSPSMMEYFYSQATPNDLFIGSLSGPGYMYPKAIPQNFRLQLIEKAEDLMKKLDLNIFEIMDYSEGATVEGNSDLTLPVINDYYKGMPDSIGFINGYAPSYTFYCKDKRPLISFDYYLSETIPENEAAGDLKELAKINKTRPYFLLIHVREWSGMDRVQNILDKLDSEFEVVPLDIFLKMAGEDPTFKEHYLEK